MLIYPGLDQGGSYPSRERNATGYLLTAGSMAWFAEHHGADAGDPYASPLRAEHLRDLPPATIVVAGFDPLRDESIAYAERLRADGVDVDLREWSGMVHGFFWMAGELQAARDLTAHLGEVLGAALGTSTSTSTSRTGGRGEPWRSRRRRGQWISGSDPSAFITVRAARRRAARQRVGWRNERGHGGRGRNHGRRDRLRVRDLRGGHHRRRARPGAGLRAAGRPRHAGPAGRRAREARRGEGQALGDRFSVVGGVDGLAEGIDLVVETVPERHALKVEVLAAAESRRPRLLATNTSALSIDELAAGLTRPESSWACTSSPRAWGASATGWARPR